MVKSSHTIIYFLIYVFLSGCQERRQNNASSVSDDSNDTIVKENQHPKTFAGKKVPVLCYHAIREVQPTDSPEQKTYSVSPANFAAQMKALAENGFTTVTPEDLHDFYTNGKPLPQKPVMITFDDGRKEQHTIGAALLEEHHFKGVFFIMTVSLGRSVYMTRADVKDLSDRGHVIGCHTWDHHKVTGYKDGDYFLQMAKPKKQLEKITGKPVTAFAYPYGLWNRTAADSLEANGYQTAFTLYAKQDEAVPMYTIERINIPNSIKIENFLRKIEETVEMR